MVIQVVYVKCKHNIILIINVLWNWWLYSYINSNTLVMKTVLWLLFDKISLLYATYILNQPINFYSDIDCCHIKSTCSCLTVNNVCVDMLIGQSK